MLNHIGEWLRAHDKRLFVCASNQRWLGLVSSAVTDLYASVDLGLECAEDHIIQELLGSKHSAQLPPDERPRYWNVERRT